MNAVQVEAVFGKVLNMGAMMETPVEGCLRLLVLVSMSGNSHVCWKYESRAKNWSATLFLSTFNIGKARHCRTLPERRPGKFRPAYNRAELWSCSSQVESGLIA